MFLLSKELNILNLSKEVFVSYIRRYVLTGGGVEPVQGKSLFSSPIFGDMFLLDKLSLSLSCNDKVFVSYIRRYVLTTQYRNNLIGRGLGFRLLYSEICSYYKNGRAYASIAYTRFRLLYSEICSY